MLIRPITPADLDALEKLAQQAGHGMTNLPADRRVLAEKIERSVASFTRPVAQPGEELYLFVLEDPATGRIVGTAGVIAAVGLSRPFYSFKLLKLPHTSRDLGKYETIDVLQMVSEYRGASEIGMLYLAPDYRRDGNGRFLSRSRFLFMAEFAQRFARIVMAEMRGVSNEQGHAVFWESLGRHFFDMDFSKADFLSALGHYQFIADLMPKHPIYVRLLPEAAQQVIGKPHPHTRPALELLQREGFRFEGCIDVFDGGPAVHCPLAQIVTVRSSRRAVITAVQETLENAPLYLLATTRLEALRLTRGPLRAEGENAVLDRLTAERLGVQVGDEVRYSLF